MITRKSKKINKVIANNVKSNDNKIKNLFASIKNCKKYKINSLKLNRFYKDTKN